MRVGCVCHVRIRHPTMGQTLSRNEENSEMMRLKKGRTEQTDNTTKLKEKSV